jgi:hypothetical protein
LEDLANARESENACQSLVPAAQEGSLRLLVAREERPKAEKAREERAKLPDDRRDHF